MRAGLSLPEALSALATRGPEVLRPPFARFAAEYRSSGRFGACLDRLKDDLADPVGDRIVETLRVAREVGGSDLGRVLRTLSTFLREDARARAELETRQGWVVQAARLAVAAPWVVLLLLATQSTTLDAYDSPVGTALLVIGGAVCLARLPADAADRAAAAGRAGAAVSAGLTRHAARSGRRDRAGAGRCGTRRRSGRCGWSTGWRPTCTTPLRRPGCWAPRPSPGCSPPPAGCSARRSATAHA